MATLILNNGDSFTLAAGTTDLDVVGNGSGGSESLIVGACSNVGLTQFQQDAGDQVLLGGAAGDYQISRSGAVVTLTDGNTTINIPASPNATSLQFSDTTIDLAVDTEAGTVNFGDQEITDTATTVTDAGDGSGHNNAPGGTAIPGASDGNGGGGTTPMNEALEGLSSPFDASGDQFAFTDDATAGNSADPLVINGFAANNSTIAVTNAGQVSFSNTDLDNDGSTDDLLIQSQAGNTVNDIELNDVVDPSALVFDDASAETALGYDAFSIA